MMIRCMIVEDEPLAARVLQKHINSIDSLKLVATCENALDAFNVLERDAIDLLFLDIKMPQLSGLDLLRSLKTPPMVILTTAFREFALDGFELEVVDYLLKPIPFDRFIKAVSKVQERVRQVVPSEPIVGPTSTGMNEFIFVRVDKRMKKVYLKDILFIESIKDYVKIILAEEVLTTYLKIGYLEDNLPSDRFVRIHKSFIVALDQVASYTSDSIEIANHHLPVGRFYKKSVLDFLKRSSKF